MAARDIITAQTAQPRYITNEAPLSVYIADAHEQIAATRHTTDRLNGTRRYDADLERELAILNRDAAVQRVHRNSIARNATLDGENITTAEAMAHRALGRKSA